MVRTKVVLAALALLMTASVLTVMAQQEVRFHRVEGYSGSVKILPNGERNETTVAVELSLTREGKSKQIVFHVQGAAVSSTWNGPARVFVSDGVLAIAPTNGQQGVLFRFVESQTPSSLKQARFDEFIVYGIARYGENKPLTPMEVQSLINTGSISRASATFKTDAVELTSKMPVVSPNIAEPELNECVAGGEGSTSCGAGGCTVICGGGYYACCTSGTCLCKKSAE